MSISDVLLPRQEVLRKEGIEGIIDVQNLNDPNKKALETRPEAFFDLTYPTGDVRIVLEKLHERFNEGGKTPGLFLLEGFKGSGKSHIELLAYHLFQNKEVSRTWLEQHGLKCNLPDNAVVVIHKFTDFPIDSIWALVFEKLGATASKLPNLNDFKKALGDKKLVLILDELEMGIQGIADPALRSQNISFLQMLSEEAARSESASVTIFASVYDSNQEPGSTLKRVQRIEVKFSEPADRQKVLFHRLFKKGPETEASKVMDIVKSYENHWKRLGLPINERYVDDLKQSYPFTPELLKMLLSNVPRRSFQGNRGPLGLLGYLVQLQYKKADLLTAAHLDIRDAAIRNRLMDLDPSQNLLQCAQNDLKDLNAQKFASEIVSAVLTGTLTSTGNLRGVSGDELARQVLKPGDDVNEYNATLQAFVKYGTFFQSAEEHYFFDIQEKPNAKVEYHSLRVDPNEARDIAFNRWKTTVFGDAQAVVLKDVQQARAEIAQRDKNAPRFVLAPKRLSKEERVQLYHGMENRNLVLLVEPKSDNFNALENKDIQKWAQRAKAAGDLKENAADAERKREYDRIEREDMGYIENEFKKAGWVYVSMRLAPGAEELEFELEPAPGGHVDQIKKLIKETVYPRQIFEEHLAKLLKDERLRGIAFGKTVRDLRAEYRKNLGFPVLMAETTLIDSLRNLTTQGKIGLRNARVGHCRTAPTYSAMEWDEVHITEPFEDESSSPRPGLPVAEPMPPIIAPGVVGEPLSPSSRRQVITLQTKNCYSTGELRQVIAEKLSESPEAKIRKCRFVVFVQAPSLDLGTIPAALRGNLSGVAEFNMELDIVKDGNFTKAQIESMAEQLPRLAGSHLSG